MKAIEYVKEHGDRIETKDGFLSAVRLMELFLFPGELQYRQIKKLSGGEKRRLFLLGILASAPNVLMLDEPTRGIDVGAKYDIYCIINELAASGKAVLVVSSELPELLGLCDRLYIVNEGKINGEMDVKDATQENVMKLLV